MSNTLWRLGLWFYVFVHLWLSWSAVISLPLALGLFLLADILADIFVRFIREEQKHHKKFYLWKVALCFLLPVIVYSIAFFLDQWILPLPIAEIYTHLNLDPLWLPLLCFYGLGLLVRLAPLFRPYELILRLFCMILAFIYAPGYEILFYPHPGALFLSLLLYLSMECLCLIRIQSSKSLFSKTWAKRTIAALLAFILPLSIVCMLLYQFISRDLTKHSSGLLKPTLNSFDFNKSLSLENEIQLGTSLLLFVHLNKEFKNRLLFKRHELAGYDEKTGFFVVDKLSTTPEYNPTQALILPIFNFLARETLVQEFFLVNLEKNAFFTLDYPTKILPLRLENREKRFRSAYQVTSEAILDPSVLEDYPQLLSAGHTQLTEDEKNLYLKTGDIKEILYLAKDIVGTEESPYRQAQLIENYLKLNYLYSLKPGAKFLGKNTKDGIEKFLFESRKGYCTYFAFAMALMTRGLGLPTRVISGFFIDAKDNLMGYYPVKAQQAHAWVEIYFDDFGWITFDPTSQQIASDSLDSVNYDYQPDNLYPFIEELLSSRSSITESPKDINYEIIHHTPKKSISRTWNIPIFLFIISIIYIMLIFWAHYGYNTQKLQPAHLVRIIVKKLLFTHYLLTKEISHPLNFLTDYPALLELYRKALFAREFGPADRQIFLAEVQKISLLQHVSKLKKAAIFFHPAWISFRMRHVH